MNLVLIKNKIHKQFFNKIKKFYVKIQFKIQIFQAFVDQFKNSFQGIIFQKIWKKVKVFSNLNYLKITLPLK